MLPSYQVWVQSLGRSLSMLPSQTYPQQVSKCEKINIEIVKKDLLEDIICCGGSQDTRDESPKKGVKEKRIKKRKDNWGCRNKAKRK